jgi:hypothetical protein
LKPAPLAARPSPRRLAAGAAIALAVLALAMAARFLLIEPRDMGLACVEAERPWWCLPRDLLVLVSVNEVWGLAALGAGIGGLLARPRWIAGLAFGAGLAGLVLYNAGTAAAGLLLGIIGLLRR